MSTSAGADSFGTVDVALAHARRLLDQDPIPALRQAEEILHQFPRHPVARLIQGAAYRRAGRTQTAIALLEPLSREQPRAVPALLELGGAYGEAGRGRESIEVLRRLLTLRPDLPDAWRLLADQLDAVGDAQGADDARARFTQAATRDPRLMAAAGALADNDLPRAENLLRAHLQAFPTDVAALRMLAEVAGRLRRYADAERLLARCLELAPSFDAARHNYAIVLNRQAKAAAALPEVERLLAKEPRNPGYQNLKAAILANLGDYAQTIAIYESVLAEFPRQPKVWMSYGHSLKTARRSDDSIGAYRRAIAMAPTLGEAWWSLANLKTFRFSPEDVAAIRDALARSDLGDQDRLHFEFALGKALEDRAAYAESFEHYASGNAIRRRLHPYRADENSRYVRTSKASFTREFFADRAGAGAPAPDPIFIVGMPRAGSTLLEQILASHPLVEGTMELPDMPQIAREIAGRRDGDPTRTFAQVAGELGPEELRTFGERYLASTRLQRRTDAPYFVDKMPNNFLYTGLIQLVLPNARIIDARRHPLACCFSGFTQHFARGQGFAYSLEDIGRYYHDYVDLMAHFDAILPGRVLRVHYEALVEDPEAEIRRVLAYCGLPFDEACLKFYENDRPVRTPSAEQVRQPIFRSGIDHWRHYEPWLDPLKRALGPVLDAYPNVPDLRILT